MAGTDAAAAEEAGTSSGLLGSSIRALEWSPLVSMSCNLFSRGDGPKYIGPSAINLGWKFHTKPKAVRNINGL